MGERQEKIFYHRKNMDGKYMKRCSTSLAFRKMTINYVYLSLNIY